MAPRTSSFELDQRSYLREKVVGVYEQIWLQRVALDELGWSELFYLKCNADWLQSHIASLSASELRRATPVVRALFAQCIARLGPEHEPSTRGHALETASGVLLGLGGRTFHSFGADALELLCGIEEADAVFDELMAKLRGLLAPPPRGAADASAVALRRCAVRLLLAFACACDSLSANLLLESVLHRLSASWVPPGTAAPPGAFALAASLELGGHAELADTARLLALLGNYRRHEARNECLGLLCTPAATALLLPVVSRALKKTMYPSAPDDASAGGNGATAHRGGEEAGAVGNWSHALFRTLDWTARLLTLESYLPASVTAGLAGPDATAANLSPSCIALLLCLEWSSTYGGAPFAAACEARPPPLALARAALLREVLGVVSLLACEPREGLHEATLRLGLSVLDALLEGEPTRELLLTTDTSSSLGNASAAMPLWQLQSGHVAEALLPSGQPLIGALLAVTTHTIGQAVAVHTAGVAAHAVEVSHRAVLRVQAAGLQLPQPALWRALFALVAAAADGRLKHPDTPALACRALCLLSLLLAHADALAGAECAALCLELAALHTSLASLFTVARAAGGAAALPLADSPVAKVLDALSAIDPAALSAADARALVIRAVSSAGAKAARAPPLASPHARAGMLQSLLRALVAQSKRDGTAAPLHVEDLV